MKKLLLLFLLLNCVAKGQAPPCNISTYSTTFIAYPGPATTYTGSSISLEYIYLCQNSTLYDTINGGDKTAVMINSGATYIWRPCGPGPSYIYIKNGGTLILKSIGCPTYKGIVFEPGAIISDPTGAMSANSQTFSCSSITFPIVNCLTGIQENGSNENYFSISPNPANNFLHINSINGNSELEEINISNAIGQQIQTLKNQKPNCEIPVDNLSDGVYYISVKQDGIVRTTKFLIHR